MPPVAPLTIALEEYAYWRSFDLKDEHPARDFLVAVQTGAVGAAANICSRLAAHEFEGIDYPSLSLSELTGLLTEIRLAPKMASALLVIHDFFAKLEGGLPADDPLSKLRAEFHKPIHTVLDPLIREIEECCLKQNTRRLSRALRER